jgi:hypothetical protein
MPLDHQRLGNEPTCTRGCWRNNKRLQRHGYRFEQVSVIRAKQCYTDSGADLRWVVACRGDMGVRTIYPKENRSGPRYQVHQNISSIERGLRTLQRQACLACSGEMSSSERLPVVARGLPYGRSAGSRVYFADSLLRRSDHISMRNRSTL